MKERKKIRNQETPTQNRGNRICMLIHPGQPRYALRIRIAVLVAGGIWGKESLVPTNRKGTAEVETMGNHRLDR